MQTRRTFIKTSILALSALLLSASAQAKSCLWKVSSAAGTLYLQGSVHVLKPENYPLAPVIENAYAESKELILEVDIKDMTSPQTVQLMMSKSLLPPGKTLQTELSPETYAQAEKAFSKAGFPIAAMQQLKPLFAAITLTQLRLQAMGFNPAIGLDQYFHGKATADGKPVRGLETVEFQINLLDSLVEENQNEFMRKTLRDIELIETQLDELLKAWSGGDIEALGALLNESFEGDPALFDKFIVARNIAWAEKLNTLLKDPTPRMAVVGAGHLPGEKGLLALLKAQGCRLEQL